MARYVGICIDKALTSYAFGESHPFGPMRLPAFVAEARQRGLIEQLRLLPAQRATDAQIGLFHTPAYIAFVRDCSVRGAGFLDAGDTPAFAGAYEAAATVAGTVLDAVDRIMDGVCRRAFVPIAGLHHARPDHAAGFCIFNDCGIAIASLLSEHACNRIAYVDIDAHHGDGVFYAFEKNAAVVIADIHEDGRFLYPGTGAAEETGAGPARGTKLNIPLPPGADDKGFLAAWPRVESFVRAYEPEFILFQCGADCLAGDPITHLRFSATAHRYAATRLCMVAEDCCDGRLLALGGGGYALNNLAAAWCAVVGALLEAPSS